MIFVDLLEVAPAKSRASTRTVFRPRSCASSAQPAPVAPPPITQTSNDWLWMLDSVSSRVLIGLPVREADCDTRTRCVGCFYEHCDAENCRMGANCYFARGSPQLIRGCGEQRACQWRVGRLQQTAEKEGHERPAWGAKCWRWCWRHELDVTVKRSARPRPVRGS